MSKSLGATKSGVGRVNRAGSGEDGTIAFKHHERGVLICKPAKRRERNNTIGTDQHEPSQSVSNTGETRVTSVRADAVLNGQVASFDIYFYAVTENCNNAVSRGDECG